MCSRASAVLFSTFAFMKHVFVIFSPIFAHEILVVPHFLWFTQAFVSCVYNRTLWSLFCCDMHDFKWFFENAGVQNRKTLLNGCQESSDKNKVMETKKIWAIFTGSTDSEHHEQLKLLLTFVKWLRLAAIGHRSEYMYGASNYCWKWVGRHPYAPKLFLPGFANECLIKFYKGIMGHTCVNCW